MIRLLISASLLPAFAGEFSAGRPSLRALHDTVLESTDNNEKALALRQLSQTAPTSLRDLPMLFDLFMRHPTPQARAAVLDCVALLGPESSHLEPGFLEFVKLTEPEAVLLGIKGLARLKSQRAVPELRKIVKGRFKARNAADLPLPGERNEWWLRYEALSALADIEGPKAFSLVKSKIDETPAAARILASAYWEQALPLILSWSKDPETLERAHEALRSSPTAAVLRRTREPMLAALRNSKVDREVRHQLALRIGLTSEPEEVAQLLKEHAASADPETKLMLSAAIFASRDPQIVPLLKEHAKSNDDPRTRIGSLLQLKDMLPEQEFRPLAEAMAKDDPDAENREMAASLLKK
jgi:hypothetical protein